MTLQEFIQEVKGLGLKWELRAGKQLRTVDEWYGRCPIAALAKGKGLQGAEGMDYTNCEYDLAAERLGLDKDTADAIVMSADNLNYVDRPYDLAIVGQVRPMLLQALQPGRGE